MQQEKERLEEVHRFLQLDFDRSSEFQDIVDLAARLCDMPVALITLLDKEVNWIKVRTGIEAAVMPRDTSFCQFGIQQSGLLIIPDASKDHRFDDNPLVQADPKVRFYAGAPLCLNNGYRLGTLCLFDVKPNNITELQQKALVILSRQVTFLMELELNNKLLKQQVEKIEAHNAQLKKIAHIQSHDFRQPLTTIMGLINTIKEDDYVADKERLVLIEDAANNLDAKIHAIVSETEK